MAPQLTTTLVHDNHSFVTYATFKLSGLGAFLSDDSSVSKQQLRFTLGHLDPGIYVIAMVGNKQADGVKYNTIEFGLSLGDTAPDHLIIFATFELFSYAGATVSVNRLKAFKLAGDRLFVYWPDALSPVDWQNHESMRQDDGVLLHVTLRSQQGSSPPSPAAATILHKTMHGEERPDIRFTVFNQRRGNGRLSDRRVLFADDRALRTGSRVLTRAVPDEPAGRWNGFHVGAPSDDDPSATYTDPDSDFEQDDDDDVKVPMDGADPHDGEEAPEPAAKRIRVKQEAQDDAEDTAEAALDEVPRIKREREERSHPPPDPVARAESTNTAQAEGLNANNMLDIVVIGASSVSWEALLFYV